MKAFYRGEHVVLLWDGLRPLEPGEACLGGRAGLARSGAIIRLRSRAEPGSVPAAPAVSAAPAVDRARCARNDSMIDVTRGSTVTRSAGWGRKFRPIPGWIRRRGYSWPGTRGPHNPRGERHDYLFRVIDGNTS
jgi:hypothetical protein